MCLTLCVVGGIDPVVLIGSFPMSQRISRASRARASRSDSCPSTPRPKSNVEVVMEALHLQRELYSHLSDEQFGSLQALLFEFVDIFAVDGASFGWWAPSSPCF